MSGRDVEGIANEREACRAWGTKGTFTAGLGFPENHDDGYSDQGPDPRSEGFEVNHMEMEGRGERRWGLEPCRRVI